MDLNLDLNGRLAVNSTMTEHGNNFASVVPKRYLARDHYRFILWEGSERRLDESSLPPPYFEEQRGTSNGLDSREPWSGKHAWVLGGECFLDRSATQELGKCGATIDA